MTPPCGVPLDVGESAVLHHPGLEKSFDDAENVAVGDLRGDAGHDNLVRDVVKEPLNISVEHVVAPLLMEFDDPLDSHVASASRSEAKRVVVKDPLEERTQELTNHLLSNAVTHGGDS